MGAVGAKAGKLTLGPLLFAVVGMLIASSASAATLEQSGVFAGSASPLTKEQIEKDEEIQLGGVGGMAVNYTGAGGVPAGTVYAAVYSDLSGTFVAMYEPKAGGGLEFKERWHVEFSGRCGPLLGTECKPLVESSPGWVDVDVDQATGNVYTLMRRKITEYSADGSKELTSFGEPVTEIEPVAKSPEKFHGNHNSGGIAVNGAGWVYVADEEALSERYHRLMVFEPQSPGDYEHYAYAGEVAGGLQGEGKAPMLPVTDAAGNVYVAGVDENYIQEYAPEAPGPYPHHSTPTCSFEYAKAGLVSLTVDPETGEPFFYSYKKETKVKWVRHLGPCEEGKFKEIGKAQVSPERDELTGLAFDPAQRFEPSRPKGILYGAAAGPVPNDGQGVGEPGQSSLGYVFAGHEDLESPPVVKEESVSHVTPTTAHLRASIDPSGFATSYRFQYLTEATYEEAGESFAGAEEAPLGGALLGSKKGPLPAAASISGLQPDTEYRYRALATSNCAPEEETKLCEVGGPAQSFHTFPAEAPGLPDHRAWELVSPAQKHGGQVLPADPRISSCAPLICKPGFFYQHFPMQSSADGEAVAYEGTPFSESGGAAIENEYVARRDPKTGWQTANPTPELLGNSSQQGYTGVSAGLTRAVIRQLAPTLSGEAPAEYPNLYTQSLSEPLALRPLVAAKPPNRPPTNFGAFEVLYAGASADGERIFFEANDALTEEVPGIAPKAADGGAAKFNLYEWHEGQLALVNVAPGNAETEAGAGFGAGQANLGQAISEEGDRAFWSDEAGQAYVRIDGEETREIPDHSGKFLSAAADGSKVLLSDGHIYGQLEEESPVLEADLAQGKGGFKGILGQAEDLSRLYFVDTEALTGEEENEAGEVAGEGEPNLYAWDGGATRFVAVLEAADNIGLGSGGGIADWAPSPANRTAQASPDGRFVAFLSRAPLTGYDNTGPCEEISGTGIFNQAPCPEAYVYDSQSGRLTCASCNPSGTAPLGWAVLRQIKGAASYLPQPRYLSDSGRLYFDSEDSLSQFDTNEGVEDVYQWEPSGIGSCKREGGCISLVSAGTEPSDSNFLAVDETGKNVFFTTRDQLTLKDKDELIDLYDAREFGGIPAETEVTEPECQGEACQPPVSVPNDPTPGSSSFEGAGNAAGKEALKPARCAKGKVRRHGSCVAKKHHKRAGRHHRRANRNLGGAK